MVVQPGTHLTLCVFLWGTDGERSLTNHRIQIDDREQATSAPMSIDMRPTCRADSEKWFGFYDLQPVSTEKATGHFVASREFDVNVLHRVLDVPLGDRDVEAESEKPRQLIEEAGTGPESIISTPLVTVPK